MLPINDRRTKMHLQFYFILVPINRSGLSNGFDHGRVGCGDSGY